MMAMVMMMMMMVIRMNVWADPDCLIVTSHAFYRSSYYQGK